MRHATRRFLADIRRTVQECAEDYVNCKFETNWRSAVLLDDMLNLYEDLLTRAERRKQQWGLEWFDEGYWTGRVDAPFGEPETGWEDYFLIRGTQ